jgi:IK cytokine
LQITGEFVNPELQEEAHLMTQEEKDRGLGSVFKRDDQRLQQRRERDDREKDPNFISESYSECYPGYQEYNREIVDSDEDEDLTKMDMGGRVRFTPFFLLKILA